MALVNKDHMAKKKSKEQQWRAAAPPGPAAKLTVLVLLVAEHRLQEGGAGCSRASRATQLCTQTTPCSWQPPSPQFPHYQITT